MATLTSAIQPVVINHHNGAPVFDIYANTQDSDLGAVAAKVNRIVKEESKNLPREPKSSCADKWRVWTKRSTG